MEGEARYVGFTLSALAQEILASGNPLPPPVGVVMGGETTVTVTGGGIGGRNQEFVLSAALKIAGSENIVIGSVDTDGTDGPGAQFSEETGNIPCLAGGIADGKTLESAKELGLDILAELKRHNATAALWRINSGVVVSPNISLIDLTVALILGRSEKGKSK